MYCKAPGDCWDDDVRNGNCSRRVAAGECQSNTADMFDRCSLSCQFCDYPPLELQQDPNCFDLTSYCGLYAGKGQCQGDVENHVYFYRSRNDENVTENLKYAFYVAYFA